MDCFQDFCLFCDRDSPDGPYCSQQCKLADLERANQSNPSSPTSPTAPRNGNAWATSQYKPAKQQQSTPGYDAPSTSSSRPRSSYFMWNPSHQQQQQQQASSQHDERQLTPSSSRTSLSSTISATSNGSSHGISTQAKQQLQEYFASFDQAKAAKRRASVR